MRFFLGQSNPRLALFLSTHDLKGDRIVLKKCTALLLVVCMLFVFGCATHIHKVGDGAKGSTVEKGRQWYILFGLVPLNDVDSHAMAGAETNYTIKTQASPVVRDVCTIILATIFSVSTMVIYKIGISKHIV